MINSGSVEIGSDGLAGAFHCVASERASVEALRRVLVAAIVSAALVVRVFGLGASGFTEDEVNKLHAIEAYRHGDFSANAEHPMLMKLAMWASISAADRWNRLAIGPLVSPEAALRLPNAVVGAATAGVVFLLTDAMFDSGTALWASVFWAFDVNAAAINRLGKEDTFLLFFLVTAAYWYERGKIAAANSGADGDRWFNRSGAAFGAMLASKYMPHYFGLHALFNLAADRNPPDDIPDKRRPFFVAMAATFLVSNAAVLLPSTWRYVAGYIHGQTLRHTGYFFAHRLYVNSVDASPWGVPPWFYATFFVTKVPLIVLAFAAAGIVWVWRHPAHRGATFVRVFLVFTLVPYSFVASKFLRYALPMLLAVDIAAAIGITWALRRCERIDRWFPFIATTASVAVAIALASHTIAAAPQYALARNAIGARLSMHGSLFPDDELYDAGVREAVAAIAPAAAAGAVVCSDATAVVAEYLAVGGRSDVAACSIAHDGLPMENVDTWVIAQDGHLYFENVAVIEQIERRMQPWLTVDVNGAAAVRVYHLRAGGPQLQ